MDLTRTEAYKRWKKDHENWQQPGFFNPRGENVETQNRRIERARRDYAYFVATYFPHIARCKS